MKNNKAFTLTNGSKALFFFIVIHASCQRIIRVERIEKTYLLAELKGMLYRHYRRVKNCMT